jgi:hypothetical protein
MIHHGLEIFDHMFESIAKINGILNAIDQGAHNLHSQCNLIKERIIYIPITRFKLLK